jgi:hypothetical protein
MAFTVCMNHIQWPGELTWAEHQIAVHEPRGHENPDQLEDTGNKREPLQSVDDAIKHVDEHE